MKPSPLVLILNNRRRGQDNTWIDRWLANGKTLSIGIEFTPPMQYLRVLVFLTWQEGGGGVAKAVSGRAITKVM